MRNSALRFWPSRYHWDARRRSISAQKAVLLCSRSDAAAVIASSRWSLKVIRTITASAKNRSHTKEWRPWNCDREPWRRPHDCFDLEQSFSAHARMDTDCAASLHAYLPRHKLRGNQSMKTDLFLVALDSSGLHAAMRCKFCGPVADRSSSCRLSRPEV